MNRQCAVRGPARSIPTRAGSAGAAKLAAVFLLSALLTAPAGAQTLSYRTSWLGNSFGGKAERWVQDWVQALYVAPDGTLYTNAYWDEGGREVGVYKEGKVIGAAGHTHGWGMTGGQAIAANPRYLFFGQSVNNEGGHLVDADTWPAKDRVWFGISRRRRADIRQGAPFAGGKGGKGDTLKGCFLLVDEAPEGRQAPVAGLAASETRLYVSDPFHQKIRGYDANSMAPLHEWSAARPGPLALAPDGSLWMIQKGDPAHAPRVLHYSPTGAPLPGTVDLPRRMVPTALCLDRRGRLLIADNGPDQNVKIYAGLSGRPRLSGAFGAKGGVQSGTPGRVAPLRFHDLSGVGADGQGNLYVAGGYGGHGDGVGTELECYSPRGARRWRLLGLVFVDMAQIDPASEMDAYAKHEHFRLDFRRQAPGSEWSYQGYTLNRFKYPQDPRLHTYPASVWVRRIGGRKFLFMTDMYSNFLQIYRFDPRADGETAIPCGYFAREPIQPKESSDHWPPGQPAGGEWIWRDRNGDGAFEANEYEGRPVKAPSLWGWSVDARGDVWQATETEGIRHFRVQGLDAHGSPIYTYTAMQTISTPAPFTNLQRADYDTATDTMYLAGYTKEEPNDHGYWKVIGRMIAAYDDWSRGNRKPRWVKVVTRRNEKGELLLPASFCVAGDDLFTVAVFDAQIEVYDRKSGAHLGSMRPGPEVGGTSGWVDIPYGIQARRLAGGEYAVLVEEDGRAKVLLYRWRPSEVRGESSR